MNLHSPKKGKKRVRNTENWKMIKAKRQRNLGQKLLSTRTELHRNYSAVRSADNKNPASYDYYAQIFNTKFNIGFHSPKKDQCDLCEMYKQGTKKKRKELETKYCEHLEEKLLSRQEKDVDKQRSKDHEIVLAVYDLQAVLPVPIGQTSAFFYKSRLNCYNFTVTEITNDKTKAYFWHEYLGNRGAIEIGTCVLLYLKSLSERSPGVNVVFYSFMGQQKNSYLGSFAIPTNDRGRLRSVRMPKFEGAVLRAVEENPGISPDLPLHVLKCAPQHQVYVPSSYGHGLGFYVQMNLCLLGADEFSQISGEKVPCDLDIFGHTSA
ncbi:uncharacterized protein LOC126735680 [Anthonomus grandis grandis]|uniref:uncharacterized protein LOC126735680 n=1 Tax=Anthonomus grandis grandis TaxID=2921223 RepID=UPI002165595A|nr:uncharacterized protein LOC126735680 [Anthonomus grandis grandis]